MSRLEAAPVATGIALSEASEVLRMRYEPGELQVLLAPVNGAGVNVTFEKVVGFRLLDEGDLLEFWQSVTSEDGWLFSVSAGGWLDLERGRSGFLSASKIGLREYLVVGMNDCVSVLSEQEPRVERHAP